MANAGTARNRIACFVLLVAIPCCIAVAAGDDERTADDAHGVQLPPSRLSGVVATWYFGSERIDRVEPVPGWAAWQISEQPDSMSVAWHGHITIRQAGSYEFALVTAPPADRANESPRGDSLRLTWRLNGKTTVGHIDGTRFVIPAVELDFGRHKVAIECEIASHHARSSGLGIAWRGPGFAWERVPATAWSHDQHDLPNGVSLPDHRLADRLVHGYRCDACHRTGDRVDDTDSRLSGPELTHVREALDPEVIVARLTYNAASLAVNDVTDNVGVDAPKRVDEDGTRLAKTEERHFDQPRAMPHFQLATSEARDIVAYLWEQSQPLPGTDRSTANSDSSTIPPTRSGCVGGDSVERTVGR